MLSVLSQNNSTTINETSKLNYTIISTEDLDIENVLFMTKIVMIFLTVGLSLFFGFLPLFCVKFRKSTRVIGLANAFSGGLFMGIALFHLLPEASESFTDYFDEFDAGSKWKHLPSAFFICFISYSLILLMEKVAFDSHSLTEHNHGDHHSSHHTHKEHSGTHKDFDLTEPLLDNKNDAHDDHSHNDGEIKKKEIIVDTTPSLQETVSKKSQPALLNLVKKDSHLCPSKSNKKLEPLDGENLQKTKSFHVKRKTLDNELTFKEKGYEEDDNEDESNEDENSDDDEVILKNVVSSKGKFASYMQARNILGQKVQNMKPDKNLLTASKILERAQARRQNSIDRDCITNLQIPSKKTMPGFVSREKSNEGHAHNHDEHKIDKLGEISKPNQEKRVSTFQQHHFNPKSNFTPYILLIALSIHGLFEGTALGVQKHLDETIFLGIAIISHKWAESLTLGVSFAKSNTEKKTFIKMMIIFSIFTPVGIISGMLLVKTSLFIQGVFLAISAGTFLYVSASEVIVEEFAITRYRYQKYFLYLCGGILVGILAYLEVENEA